MCADFLSYFSTSFIRPCRLRMSIRWRSRLITLGTLLLGNYMMLQKFGLMAVAALGLSTVALADGAD